jgi:hypothetical protein
MSKPKSPERTSRTRWATFSGERAVVVSRTLPVWM